jgi:hypothetical protein
MDFWKALEELHTERRRLNHAIAVLEEMQRSGGLLTAGRRGRKTMPPEERRVVAERMRAYWARRKDGNRAGAD